MGTNAGIGCVNNTSPQIVQDKKAHKSKRTQESSDDSSTTSDEDGLDEYLKRQKRRAKKLDTKDAITEIIDLHKKVWLSQELLKTKLLTSPSS